MPFHRAFYRCAKSDLRIVPQNHAHLFLSPEFPGLVAKLASPVGITQSYSQSRLSRILFGVQSLLLNSQFLVKLTFLSSQK